MQEQLKALPISDIYPNPFQPRIEFSDEELAELSQSIAENGLIQPIIVRKSDIIGYELIAGERRLRACKRLGMTEIPAVVKEVTDQESRKQAIIENLQRSNLNPIEEAEGYKALMEDYGLTQEEAAERCGVSPRHYLDMEAGRVNPKLSTVIHIASESNISLDVLKSEVRGTHAVSLPPE